MTWLHNAVGLFRGVVEHGRGAMEHATDAVARVVFHNAAPVALHDRLDHTAHLCVRHTRAANSNRRVQALAAVRK